MKVAYHADSGLYWLLDPDHHYTDPEITPSFLVEACGLIPSFIQYDDDRPLLKQLEERYGFGSLIQMKGGSMKDLTIYQYPEDPDLYPYMAAGRAISGDSGELIAIYPYGIVAVTPVVWDEERVIPTGKPFVTRMD